MKTIKRDDYVLFEYLNNYIISIEGLKIDIDVNYDTIELYVDDYVYYRVYLVRKYKNKTHFKII